MTAAGRLAVEHLTVPSASPLQIVELAASLGCAAATVLVAPFAAFPQTGGIDLVGDAGARRAVREAAARDGVAVALAYPFVLSRRTPAATFGPALEAAAEIGAAGAGLLVYERDAGRAGDAVGAFCDAADALGLRPVLEFFGGSAVAGLAEADALGRAEATRTLALCVDHLHLERSGGRIADLAGVATPVVHAQISDAPRIPRLPRETEAAHGRLEPGCGELDIAGFIRALPPHAWIGVEVPPAHLTPAEEIARAVRIMRRAHAIAAAAAD